MKFKRVTVKKNERGLLLRNGDFERVLAPGTHWLFAGFDALKVDTFALEQPAFNHPLADYLMAAEPAVVEQHFVRVELNEHQAGLRTIWLRGRPWPDGLPAAHHVVDDVTDAITILLNETWE